MKLESFTPGFPVADEKLGSEPRHSFVVGSRGVESIGMAEGCVIVNVRIGGAPMVSLLFANGGVGRIAATGEEKRKP